MCTHLQAEANNSSKQLSRLELERSRLQEEAKDFQPGDVQAIEEAKQVSSVQAALRLVQRLY